MIEINIKNNGIPKYQQIIDSIITGIERGELQKYAKIPSLSYMMKTYDLSQDTVLNAYNHLKSQGIISSQVGKGYFISKTHLVHKQKILVVFDNFTPYKEDLYNAMVTSLGNKGELDLFFHHNKPELFKQIVSNAKGNYTSYVIMPTLIKNLDESVLATLPVKNVYLLDRTSDELAKRYPFVCQNFENDIYKEFKRNSKRIIKFKQIQFVSSNKRSHILLIEKGLQRFTEECSMRFKSNNFDDTFQINPNELIVCLSDRHLVKIILWAQEKQLVIGKDFGIISYNETELKQVVGNGISTISTDFTEMGNSIIDIVLKKKRDRKYNKTTLNIRKSI